MTEIRRSLSMFLNEINANNFDLPDNWYANNGKLGWRLANIGQLPDGVPRRRRDGDDIFIDKNFAEWDIDRQKLIAQVGEVADKNKVILLKDGGQITLVVKRDKKGNEKVSSILLESNGVDSVRTALLYAEKQGWHLDKIKWESETSNGMKRLLKSVEIEKERRRLLLEDKMNKLSVKTLEIYSSAVADERKAKTPTEKALLSKVVADASYRCDLLEKIQAKVDHGGPKLSVVTQILAENSDIYKPGARVDYDTARIERVAILLGIPVGAVTPVPTIVPPIPQPGQGPIKAPNMVAGITGP